MARRLVTPIGNFTDLGDGEFELADDNVFGYLEKTHVTQGQVAIGPDPQSVMGSLLIHLEVSWAHARVPAVSLHLAGELAFIGFEESVEEDDEEDDDFETQGIQENQHRRFDAEMG